MSKFSDAFAVLFGKKIAVPPGILGAIGAASTAALAANQRNPTMSNQAIATLKSDAEETAEHSAAIAKIQAITEYLLALPAFFVVILKQLDDLRAKASLFDEERLAFLDVKNQLQARGDQLELLIGGAATATTAADAADDGLLTQTPPPAPPLTGDPSAPNPSGETGGTPTTPATEPPAGDLTSPGTGTGPSTPAEAPTGDSAPAEAPPMEAPPLVNPPGDTAGEPVA